MNTIIGALGKSDKFIDLSKQIENKQSPLAISGLSDVGMAQIIAGINGFNKKNILYVTYNEIQAKNTIQNLKSFGLENISFFPKKEIVTYDYIAESQDLPYERIETLNKIIGSKKNIVVTTVEALMQKIVSKETLYKNILDFKVGDTCNLEDIKSRLINLGYTRYDLVDGKGQFSVRGGIIDISQDEKIGIRIELWGDEIDSIRSFNISSQRSINALEKITIYPAHEYILEHSIENICNKISDTYDAEEDIEIIKSGNYISKKDKYFKKFYEKQSTLLDYLDEDCLVLLDEIGKIEQRQLNIINDIQSLKTDLLEKNKIVPEALEVIEQIDIERVNNKNQIIYLEKQDLLSKFAEKYEFQYREINYYKSEIDSFFEDINRFRKEKKDIYILLETKQKAKKLQEILEKQDIACRLEEKLDKTIIAKSSENIITISVGKILNGFENFDINQVVISADDLIDGGKKKRRFKNTAFNEGEKIVFADLKPGDYVVHKNYGIGIFLGVNTMTADQITKDYIKIKYKNDDILYVPTNQLDSIRKYVGGDAIKPPINSIGGKDWERIKTRVKNNLREVAKELIELYAKRQKIKGFAFSKDTPWQQQFEEKFDYEETEDQLRCIEEVKHDMEMEKPMDRLLCGDVGYGKTEVAIRAAFKAVMDQKQVAYLVPTTVLASQQYDEFKKRMEQFPIKVEVLNRFKSKKYQDEVVRKLKLGEIDVVVGTHRMLSKDVEFKDLGLLIIDEEHRFGVKAKEKIKEYKTNVDVLTMTATPIPRTMHMSIVGIRDMSVIYEPPHNRKAVQTYVLEYDREVIKEAITKELEREGQVFYLYNRVDTIEQKSDEISKLVPEADVAYAHGQMSGKEIEDIMKDFVDKKVNVLVCTTILESGIDIPNANTIIVENADRMGLATLYQIRGRVGRSDKQAYAYITYKKDKIISEEADKRLKAIKEFTELGSGFKIAMRDLEIRGAGSLLGEIQSGHLEQVGYDTYYNLLDEVVKEMKGIEIKPEIDIQIDLDVTSYIPDEYIPDQPQKIEIYQDIALCKNEEDIQDVVDEIIDRFGNMPKQLENLLDIARIKYLAKGQDISKIASRRDKVVFTFEKEELGIDIIELVKKYDGKIKFSSGIKPMVTLKIDEGNEKEILKDVTEFLKEVYKEEICK